MKKGEIKIPTRDLLEDLVRVADLLGKETLGRDEYLQHARHGHNTYRRRFGSWNNALEAAGIIVTHRPRRNVDPRKADYDYVPKQLRYLVMNRDGFRCVLCGASPKEDGVRLEADHIIPRWLHGRTTYENLRTLCRGCNQGKGGLVVEKACG